MLQATDTAIAESEIKEEEVMKKSAIRWRVKHAPAKTVYTIHCRQTETLTVGFGVPIHPDDAYFVARADERKDVPEHWALWGSTVNMGWMQSTHDTKEAARAALRANRLAPPKPPTAAIAA